MVLIRGFPWLMGVLTLQAFAGGLETVPLVDGSLTKNEVTCIRVAHFGVSLLMADLSLCSKMCTHLKSMFTYQFICQLSTYYWLLMGVFTINF